MGRSDDRRLALVRGALEAWATGEFDGRLSLSAHAELGRSLVSVERWLAGTEASLPHFDVIRATRRLSDARAVAPLPARARGCYHYLRALRFSGARRF